MASSPSCASPSSEATSYFTCQSGFEMESSELDGWSQSDDYMTPPVWSVETSYASFSALKKDPQWCGFFIDSDKVEVGKMIAKGGEAELYEARLIQPWGARDGAFDLVVKAMKTGYTLNPEWRIRMLAARSKYNQFYDLPLLTILEGTRMDNNTVRDDKWLRGRFAFVMHRRWGDLRALIDSRMKTRLSLNGPFSIDQAIYLMLRIAEQMDFLHTKHGIVHRDLKSSNVLLWTVDGDEMLEPLVADYECSDRVVGTGFWSAPEIIQQLRNHSFTNPLNFTFKSDVYSYGMVSYEILSGSIPFYGSRLVHSSEIVLSGHRPDLPSEVPLSLRSIIERCWRANPEERPNFSEICESLKQIQSLKLATIVNDNKVHKSATNFKESGLPNLIGDNLVIDLSRDYGRPS